MAVPQAHRQRLINWMALAPHGELMGRRSACALRRHQSSKVSTDSVDNSLDNLFNPRFKAEKSSPPADWLIFNHYTKIYKYQYFTDIL